MAAFTIRSISAARDLWRFIRLPYALYEGDPNFVAPLEIDQRKLLDPKRNPFFEHGEMQLFLAEDTAGRPVGRIAAILNRLHDETWHEKAGFFGFFESTQDAEVAGALVKAAADWCRERGAEFLRGPVNPSINDTCGTLVEGFDRPPVVMMPYNPPYHDVLLVGAGLSKVKDLLAWWVDQKTVNLEKLERGAAIVFKRNPGLVVRPMDFKKFDQEAAKIFEIYRSAWEQNWGAVPMTDHEATHLAKELKPIADPKLVQIAELNGEVVGVSVGVPDLNQALIKIKGKLLPFGLPKLLWYSRKVNGIRVLIMGVKAEYRRHGIDAIFHLNNVKHGREKGYDWGELSWVLEDNVMMNRVAEMLHAVPYKRYRMYQMPL